MSPSKSLPPPNHRLPARYHPHDDDPDEPNIDIGDDGKQWIADVFDHLWEDLPHQKSRTTVKSGEAGSRPKKKSKSGQGGFWDNFADQTAKPLKEELDALPEERQVVWALVRDESGWYLYFNHNYRKLITVSLITLAMLATGKIPEAIELIFKLFF